MRIVLDTNVVVSGLFFGGIPREILDLGAEGKVIFCFTTVTFSELERILWHRKFAEQRKALVFSIGDFLTEIRSRSLFFSTPEELPQLVKENRADNYFLACALSSGASFIVSGDKHLLKLKEFKGISILKPQEFIAKIKK